MRKCECLEFFISLLDEHNLEMFAVTFFFVLNGLFYSLLVM